MDVSSRPRSPLWTIIPVAVVLLSACGSTSATRVATASPSAEAGRATPQVTPTPRPTPRPDPAALLSKRLVKLPDRIEATFEGTLIVGEERRPVTGHYAGAGRDFHVKLTVQGSDISGSTEQIYRDDASYTRTDEGAWMRTDDWAENGSRGVVNMLANATVLRGDPAPSAEDGVARLELRAIDLGHLARRLGLLDRHGEVTGGAVALLVRDDGAPVRMALELEIETAAANVTVTSAWSLEYRILSIGEPVHVERPESAWRVHSDVDVGYVLFYPDDWRFSVETDRDYSFHVFTGPSGGEIQVHPYPDMAGTTEDTWFAESAQLLERDFGARPQQEAASIAGRSARLYTMEVTDHGRRYLFQQAVVYGDMVAWDLNWWSLAGNEAADRERFSEILATFVPLR